VPWPVEDSRFVRQNSLELENSESVIVYHVHVLPEFPVLAAEDQNVVTPAPDQDANFCGQEKDFRYVRINVLS
jgi:hypothetical protein